MSLLSESVCPGGLLTPRRGRRLLGFHLPLSKASKHISGPCHGFIFPNPTSDTLLLKIESGLPDVTRNHGGFLNLILFT